MPVSSPDRPRRARRARNAPGRPLLVVALTACCLAWALGPSATARAQVPGLPSGAGGDASAEPLLPTRTPLPAPTAGAVTEGIASRLGDGDPNALGPLGITVEQWVSVGISLLLALGGVLVGAVLLGWLFRRVTRRTSEGFGTRVRGYVGWQARALVVVLSLHLALRRLPLVETGLGRTLLDLLYVVGLGLASVLLWRGADLAHEWYEGRIAGTEREDSLGPALYFLMRIARIAVLFLAGLLLLTHFGVNIPALAAALGVGGLVLGLAARDTIADMIAGFLILFDRPFRVGDRIEIEEIATWGDVTEIGLRTTRVRTLDNRMVIVPNSLIGSNQVVNYTFPDTRYRIQIDIGLVYGQDVERVRRVIVDAVRGVDGVLGSEIVEALYVEMGDSGMIFRARFWIESYVDTRRMFDKVNTALYAAFTREGIELAYPTQTVDLRWPGPGAQRDDSDDLDEEPGK